MRLDDFFIDTAAKPGSVFGGRQLNETIIDQLRRGPLSDRDDPEVAVPLATLVHNELEHYATGGGTTLSDEQIREAIRTLQTVLERLGARTFRIPFRDYTSFRSWWVKNDAHGSWQARRDLLDGIFNPIHDHLAAVEQQSVASTLAQPISSHVRTG